MAFCKYSNKAVNQSTISIDVNFLNDYLPYAPENCLKVYLFGLLKCQNSAEYDNTIENFEKVLNLSHEDIISAFLYWQDQNLVQVLETNPIEIRYLPTKDNIKNLKKIDSKKYATFVAQLQATISERQINPNEYYKYIDFVETYNFLPEDFIMIVKYCTDKKGKNINCNYILTVAKVWADEGIRTAEKIEEKIEGLTLLTSDVSKVAKLLKFKGNLSIEHQQMFEKWTKSYGFATTNILLVAKKVATKTKNFGFETLDKTLTKYYELKLLSYAEIEEYEENKTALIKIAKDVNKALGLYYESVESEVDTYILPWLNKGFNEQSILQIANFCFKTNVRTLDGMDSIVAKFNKLGLTTTNSINNHLGEIVAVDKKIKEYLTKLGIERRVNSFDRSFYRTWTYSYKFSDEIIEYAIELAKNKNNALQYANALLTNWYDNKLNSLQEIKKFKTENIATAEKKAFVGRSYTEEEVNALFDDLDQISL